MSSRTGTGDVVVVVVAVGARTEVDDDVVDVTSFSALDAVELKLSSSLSALRRS